MAAVAAAAGGACAARISSHQYDYHDYEPCEAGPSSTGSTGGKGGGGSGGGGGNKSLGAPGASSLRSDSKDGENDGGNGEKKTHRVTIKDTNPTYHRAASGGGGVGGGGGTRPKDVIISVREKHGSFRAAVPCMPTPVALICCLLNIVAPGTGTLISAFACFCCGYPEVRPVMAFFWNILAAFLQMLTFVFIVGWIWSIIWGMTFMSLATEYAYVRQIQHGKHHAAVLRSDSARSA